MTSKAVMQNAKIFPLLYCIYDVHIEVGWNLYDSDNLVALLKWPIDWLKYRGLIKDDGPKRFWPVQFPTQAMVARKNRFVYFWLYTSSQIELSRMYARKGLLP